MDLYRFSVRYGRFFGQSLWRSLFFRSFSAGCPSRSYMAKKKNLTDRQKRIRRRRRKSTMSRVVFALEIIILVVLMGGLFVYAKLGNMNYEDLNFENVDVNQSVEENQVMKGYTSIALVGLDSREGELDGDVNSDTMIIASINNDTKKVKLDVSKLKAKKKYYIRVRTYKTVKVNGKSKKIYSGWSKVKAVTTKK